MTSFEDIERDAGKVGAMIRNMSGDIGEEFRTVLKTLYSGADGKISEVGESCCFWHWIVVKYAVNPYMMRKYVAIIQTSYDHKISLNENEEWKKLLRVVLPEEILMKMNEFTTQVPKMAIMLDQKKEEKKERYAEGVSW